MCIFTSCVPINAYKESVAFPTSIFLNLSSAKRYYVDISRMKSHPDQTINVESADISLLTTVSNVCFSLH